MRALITSAICGLLVSVLLIAAFVIGYGPYRFTPAAIPPDVANAMPAEKRAEWASAKEFRVRGLVAIRELSGDPPMQLALAKAGGILWLSGFLSVLMAARWLRR
jgi:hypothetical protein